MSWFMDKLREPEEQIDTVPIDTTTDLPVAIGDDSDEAQLLADGTSDTALSVEQAADPIVIGQCWRANKVVAGIYFRSRQTYTVLASIFTMPSPSMM